METSGANVGSRCPYERDTEEDEEPVSPNNQAARAKRLISVGEGECHQRSL